MNEHIFFYVALTEGILLLIFVFLFIYEKNKKTEIKIGRQKNWYFNDEDSDRFIITNVNMSKVNSWLDPQIKLWLSTPAGFGIRPDDKKLALNGKVKNPPEKGSIKIFVLLSANEIWYQGEYFLNEKGEWNGWIYLSTGEGEEYKKIIRLELYEWKNDEKIKIDTYDIIIE